MPRKNEELVSRGHKLLAENDLKGAGKAYSTMEVELNDSIERYRRKKYLNS